MLIDNSLSGNILNIIKDIENKKDTTKNFNKLIEIMNSRVVRIVLNEFLEFPKELDDNEIHILGILLKSCNLIYSYSGESTGLTDTEYDELVSFYNDINKEDLSNITEEINDNTIHHTYKSLRGYIDKIYKLTDEDVLKNKSQKGVDQWLKSTEKRYVINSGNDIDLLEEEVIVMPKFDGISCIIECDEKGNVIHALTRGNTTTNEAKDITPLISKIYSGPFKNSKYKYGIKTELMVLNDDLDRFNNIYATSYKNTRSIAAAIVNTDSVDERAMYLNVIPLRYEYLIDNEEGLQDISPEMFNYPTLICKLKELNRIREFSFKCKNVSPGFRCDGSVICFTNPKVKEILGREDSMNKYEVAFKFTEETAYSEVVDIEFSAGLFGKLTPVVKVKPVKMKGNTVQSASLGSYQRFMDEGLAKGDIVKILYDIIPYIKFDNNDPACIRSNNKPIKAPRLCPDCNEPLTLSESGVDLHCTNPNCDCRKKGKILNYCVKVGIDGISFATVDDFYKAGLLKEIPDLYHLKNHIDKLQTLDGYGEIKVNNIISSIESSRQMSYATLLGSIGISGISIKKFQTILKYLSIDDLLELIDLNNLDIFTPIPGVKEKTAQKLIDGLKENEKIIKKLQKELLLYNESEEDVLFTCVFTKIRDDKLEEWIKEHGGEVSNSVTKDTSFVIVPNNVVSSSKIDKAKKYNIPIIVIEDVKKYIENTY